MRCCLRQCVSQPPLRSFGALPTGKRRSVRQAYCLWWGPTKTASISAVPMGASQASAIVVNEMAVRMEDRLLRLLPLPPP